MILALRMTLMKVFLWEELMLEVGDRLPLEPLSDLRLGLVGLFPLMRLLFVLLLRMDVYFSFDTKVNLLFKIPGFLSIVMTSSNFR